MAQKVQVILVDDLDGGTAHETVNFSLDGVSYELDLSADNAERLREALSPYVGAARRVGGGRAAAGRSRRVAAAPTKTANTSAIRQWAREHGHKVNDRGRIPASIVEAYEKAQG